ncbi:SGNH/GDSL hydrolase family protein [Paenisporosarcina quisquiliarum]|uniref:SGNH/GDSL hydrolase family protein n=1 Tax=Paenisporosarcina quisquiliarum TaxID=365346 RepID=UPI00373600B2
MKKKFLFALSVFVMFMYLPIQASALVNGPVSYLALGDSLAAGQTPNREIDTGYSDLIAQEIARIQPLAFYSKALAFPGYTTAQVLERVQSEEAKPLLENANLITVSAGANDLLRLIQVDGASGSIAFQQIPADYSLNKARENMVKLLAELKKRAPNAEIYVMGYYFAYPHVRESQKIGTAKQLNKLNEILALVSKEAGVQFVSVDAAFGDRAKDKIPNPTDVHPNAEGYRAMANHFLAMYSNGQAQVLPAEIPPANPLTFEELMETQNSSKPAKDESALLPSSNLSNNLLVLTELRPLS